ncbi:MAG: hypothetical protein LBQ83_02180 [Candidatus Margulisbacteria bacterium]|jgi:hypothetical protein|nr:hypothetical protein [Candidatus Margulisiibacteriota bacterium]
MLRWRLFGCFFLLWAAAWANPLDIRQYFKGILEEQLSALVSKNVTIGRLQGNVYQRLILNEVEITEPDGSKAALIGRAEVEYNLKDIILQKFDVLSNIHEIKVYDAFMLVKRDARAKWNYTLARREPDAGARTPRPRMRVSFVNSSLRYIDEKGFGRPLPRRYDQQAVLNGWVDIDGADYAFSATAAVSADASVQLSGRAGQDYEFTVEADGVGLAEHGWYALSFSDYILQTGHADIRAHIQAPALNATPNVEVAVRLTDVDFQPSDYLTQPLRQINGSLVWRGNQLRVNQLRAVMQDAALTLNGSVLLAAEPELDIQAEISGLDFQKNYSKYVALENLAGRGSAVLRLQGTPGRLVEQGSLQIAGLAYNNMLIGEVAAEVSLQDGQGTAVFQVEEKVSGQIALQLDGDKILAVTELKTDGLEFYQQKLESLHGTFVWQDNRLRTTDTILRLNGQELLVSADYGVGQAYALSVSDTLPDEQAWLRLALAGDAENNIAVSVNKASLDLAQNSVFQKYFPDGAGQVDFTGGVFWRNKQLSLDGRLNLADLQYSDLQVARLAGNIAADADGFALRGVLLDLADSQLAGDMQARLTEGAGPLWPRLQVSADIDVSVNLAAAHDFARRAEATYLDVQQRLQAGSQQTLRIQPVVLPPGPLYVEYGGAVLDKFAEFIPAAAPEDADRTLDVQGRLRGRAALSSRDGELSLAADLSVRDGVLQGQRAQNVRISAVTNAGRISANVDFDGLTVAGVDYDKLRMSALIRDGSIYFNEVNLLRGRREARELLAGKFPLLGLWDERYRQDNIDLRLNLNGGDLVLFSPFVQNIGAVSSSGNIALTLRGTLDTPLLSADSLDLAGTRIELDNNYFQEILIRRAVLGLQNNALQVKELEFLLRSYDQYTPPLTLSGGVQLRGWSLRAPEQLVLDSNLALEDVRGRLNIRNVYNGDFALQDIGLHGELLIPLNPAARSRLSRRIRDNEPVGPLLDGSLSFANGSLYLFKTDRPPSVRSEKNLAVQLDLELNVRNDVRVLSGDSLLLTGEFSSFLNQINIGLRDENPPVQISGSTNFLRVDGRIFLEDGYFSFINRKFTLLESREQEKYFLSQPLHRPQDNYLEFVVTEKFTLEPHIVAVAQTTVYDTQLVTGSLAVSADAEAEPEPQTITTESDYLVFMNGSIFDLSSITFERYKKENLVYVLDGEPYALRDPQTGRTIEQSRFQELAYAISPPFIKSAIALSRGTGAQTVNDATRETLRDLTITEINLLMRSLLKPAEKAAAEWTGLYDVRIKRDLGQDAARLANLEAQTALPAAEDTLAAQTEYLFGLELVKELWKERLFFRLDTNFDRNLQTRNINITVNSYKLTCKILKNYFIDELSLNIGSELDILQNDYVPVLSLEMLHSF